MLNLIEVSARLTPICGTLIEAHLGAAKNLREVAGQFPEIVAPFNATERANFLHSQIRNLISKGVETLSGAQVAQLDFFAIAVGKDLLLRFKFLGNGNPANVSTEQQRLLARQQYTEQTMQQLTIAGIETPPTTVTCGYTLDGLDIGQVRIQRNCIGYQPWYYDIYGGDAVVEQLWFPGMAPVSPAIVRSSIRKQSTASHDR